MSPLDASLAKKPWLAFHALAAEHGDCIVLSYGDERGNYRLVIDAGVEGTNDRLRQVLGEDRDAVWELLVVTHVDADHIGGVLALLQDDAIAGRFQDVWFNGRQHLDPPGTESLGVQQGLDLQRALELRGISWNSAFDHRAVCVDSGGPTRRSLSSGASVTVLSPSAAALSKFRILWDHYLNMVQVGKEPAPKAAPTARGLESMGGAVLDIAQLAATKTALDRSVTNASSIALLFDFRGMRVLLGGDAHPNVLVASAAHLDPSMRSNIDVFKLPHHGSAKNVTEALLKTYPASRYVISTNGARHDHPDDVAVARVVHVNPDAQVLFNYPSAAYERWRRQASSTANTFSVFAGEGEEGIRVELRPLL